MNRRQFTKIAAALTGLFALPTESGATTPVIPGTSERLPGKITRLRVGSLATKELREQNNLDRQAGKVPATLDPPEDDKNYWAEAIEDGGKFYYRAKGVSIEVEEHEFHQVVANPTLYYFSTALKLHYRIERVVAGEMIQS